MPDVELYLRILSDQTALIIIANFLVSDFVTVSTIYACLLVVVVFFFNIRPVARSRDLYQRNQTKEHVPRAVHGHGL